MYCKYTTTLAFCWCFEFAIGEILYVDIPHLSIMDWIRILRY